MARSGPRSEVVRLGLGARVAAEGVEGKLGWVAAADEDAERAVPLGAVGRRVRAAAPEQLERGGHLLLGVLGAERGVDVLAIDPELAQAARDAVGAPGVEAAPVLGEALGVAGVVQVSELDQLRDHLVGHRGLDALAEQHPADLVHGPVALVERPPGEGARLLDGVDLNRLCRAIEHQRRLGRGRVWTVMARTVPSAGRYATPGWDGVLPSHRHPMAEQDGGRRAGSNCLPPQPPLTFAPAAAAAGLRRLDRGDRGHVGRLVAVDRLDEVLADAERFLVLALDPLRDLLVLVEEGLGVVAPLAEPLVAVGEERARLGDDVVLDPQVEDAARGRDALAELDVELGLAERRRDLVLDDLDADPVADRLGAVLQRLDAADVQALGRVELQRAAARLCLRGGAQTRHASLPPPSASAT